MERDVSGIKTNFANKDVGFIHVIFHLRVSTGPGVTVNELQVDSSYLWQSLSRTPRGNAPSNHPPPSSHNTPLPKTHQLPSAIIGLRSCSTTHQLMALLPHNCVDSRAVNLPL